ncbi:unnamed protein product [Blepharisma stoltei]|uniref:Uncharacterized protein n=1 Tax=Blepharisma stoltei TaxID=1481888 RepID=A0AAU9IUJ8_9CILI|nr:unnamed protein product [Blepharisma stoltei]
MQGNIAPSSKAVTPIKITNKSVKFHFSITKTREVSYVDLFEANMTQKISETSSTSTESKYSYHAMMRNMLYRLENFGDLSKFEKTVQKRKKAKREPDTSSSESELLSQFYDLKDEFIDDSEIKDNSFEDETLYEKAVKEGFFVEYPEEISSVESVLDCEFKRKRVSFGDHNDLVHEYLNELQKKCKNIRGNNPPIPKEAFPVLLDLGEFTLKHEHIDTQNLYEIVGKILHVNTNTAEKAVEKLLKQKESTEQSKKVAKMLKSLKEKLMSESKSDEFQLNVDIKNEFNKLLDAIEKFVAMKNSFNEKFMKYKKKMTYKEEEAKIIPQLNLACNNKIDFKDLSLKESSKQMNGYGTIRVPLKGRYSSGNDRFFDSFVKVKCEEVD